MLTQREKTVVSTAVIAAVGVGVLFVLSRYRRGIMSRLKALNQRDPLRGQQVHIINTADDCRMIVEKLQRYVSIGRLVAVPLASSSLIGHHFPQTLSGVQCAGVRL